MNIENMMQILVAVFYISSFFVIIFALPKDIHFHMYNWFFFRFVYKKYTILGNSGIKHKANIVLWDFWVLIKNKIENQNKKAIKPFYVFLVLSIVYSILFVFFLLQYYFNIFDKVWNFAEFPNLYVLIMTPVLIFLYVFYSICMRKISSIPQVKIDKIHSILSSWEYIDHSLCFDQKYNRNSVYGDPIYKLKMFYKTDNLSQNKKFKKVKLRLVYLYDLSWNKETILMINYLLIWGFHLDQESIKINDYQKEYQNFVNVFDYELDTLRLNSEKESEY